jgi:hypothetical protein
LGSKIAITQRLSKKLFGNESAIGKKIQLNHQEKEVCAVVSDWTEHTNLTFDILFPLHQEPGPRTVYYCISFIKLKESVDATAFQAKLSKNGIQADTARKQEILLTPLTKLHTQYPLESVELQFNYLLLFALSSLLVVVCALLNFLILYINRLQMRLREMVLRKICGGSQRKLYMMLGIELTLNLLLALLLGLALIETVMPSFKKMAHIKIETGPIWLQMIIYFGFILLCTWMICLMAVRIVRHQNASRKSRFMTGYKLPHRFRKAAVFFQLVIGIGFVFSSVILMKQLYFLRNTDLGFERFNIAVIYVKDTETMTAVSDQLKSRPFITDLMSGHDPIFGSNWGIYPGASDWDGKTAGMKDLTLRAIMEYKPLCDFWGIQVIQGEMLGEQHSEHEVMINEAAAKAFGWKDAVGKSFSGVGKYTVIGVCKDFHTTSPTVPVTPTYFCRQKMGNLKVIMVKYQEGKWSDCKSQIEQLAGDQLVRILNVEEVYDNFLTSENTLLKLMKIVSVACILISIFGIYSLVTLSCEQRRKEIAIRKVNGATVKDILDLFVKEYLWLLGLSALVAFPVGTIIMKRWMEHYTLQTALSAWVYIAIFLGITFVVALSIGKIVLTAARQNPADVIRTE